MKKIILHTLAITAMLCASPLLAQEFSFTNEVSTDVVTIDRIWADKTNFAGISENAAVEFSSEKLDAYLEVEFSLRAENEFSETSHLNFAWTDLDFWLHFRPIEILTLAFHDDLWMNGSYLPLWDDNAPAGGIGSSGFTLMVSPVEGLRIGATIPMENMETGISNFLNGDDTEMGEDKPFDFGIGVEYDFGELFSIGAKVGDIIDADGIYFGLFAMLRPLTSDDLIIRAGYSHYAGEGVLEELDYSENFSIAGKNMYNASVEYTIYDFSIAAEIAGDAEVDDEENVYDMYIGAGLGYSINENFSVALGGQCFLDFASENAKPAFGIEPAFAFTTGNHELSIGADIEFHDGTVFAKFPISWVYSF